MYEYMKYSVLCFKIQISKKSRDAFQIHRNVINFERSNLSDCLTIFVKKNKTNKNSILK